MDLSSRGKKEQRRLDPCSNFVVKINPLPPLFVIFSSKKILVNLFLSIKAPPYEVTWNDLL